MNNKYNIRSIRRDITGTFHVVGKADALYRRDFYSQWDRYVEQWGSERHMIETLSMRHREISYARKR